MPTLKGSRNFSSRDCQLIAVYVGATCYVAACTYARNTGLELPSLCPWRSVGLYCPGCGMTRAFGCVLTGDFQIALKHNPLVLIVAPYVAFTFFDLLAVAVTGRSAVTEWPKWFTILYQAIFLIGFFCLGSIRILSWIAPSCNPLNIGLPAT